MVVTPGPVDDGEADGRIPAPKRAEAATPGSGLFPITYSILSAEALRAEVAAAYAIDTPLTCELLRRGMNDTSLLTTRDHRYIVRVYRARWRSLPEICYELELLGHLAAKGVSVSMPIADKRGQLVRPLAAPEGTRQLVLFTYAEGKPLSWTDEGHCHLAGRLAAIIHAASDDFVSRHSRSSLDLEHLIDAPLAAIRPYFQHGPDDWAYLEELGGKLRARAEAAAQDGLDWGVCHGDLAAQNIHVTKDQAPTVFDFDYCGPGWRAYDLAAGWWVDADRRGAPLRESFLKGYTEVRPLAAADLAAVPLFQAINRLSSLGVRARNVALWGTLQMVERLADRRLASFREWAAQLLEAGERRRDSSAGA